MGGRFFKVSKRTVPLLSKNQTYLTPYIWSDCLWPSKRSTGGHRTNANCENISLTGISKIFGISSGYLSSLFCEFNGLNFIDYLSNLRIQKAKALLKNSDLRIYEIAEKVGYCDAYYFSAAFKKIVGINPTDYREKRKLFK